MTGEIPGHDS